MNDTPFSTKPTEEILQNLGMSAEPMRICSEAEAEELPQLRARIAALEAERDRLRQDLVGIAESERDVKHKALEKVAAFLEHRFGNSDGDDWHDESAGFLGDVVDAALKGETLEVDP